MNNIDELKELVKKAQSFKIQIKVIANSKVNSIDFCEDYIKIKTTHRAIEGRANKSVIEYLSKLLAVPKSKIKITFGEKSSLKILQFF